MIPKFKSNVTLIFISPYFQYSSRRIVNDKPSQQLIRGISLSSSGQATVDPKLTEVLIDVAIKIDDDSKFPVDVEHVLAAIVLASRVGEVNSETVLDGANEELVSLLGAHVETVFQTFGGKVGTDD